MTIQVEFVDVLGISGGLNRLGLLYREQRRRHSDTSWKTWILSMLDDCLGVGYWWFPTFEYRCLNPDGSIPTITTQCFGYGNGRFGHPAQNRAITLREAALLQTFPENYRFLKKGGTGAIQCAWASDWKCSACPARRSDREVPG